MAAVGWVGLGKLGLTCSLVLADAGHEVYGYDVSDWPERVLDGSLPPPVEYGIEDLLPGEHLRLVPSVADVVKHADVVFVAVQTPHAPEYGGERPLPDEPRDFEYGFLATACRAVCAAAAEQHKPVTMVVVSTVLPGTCNRYIRPLLNPYVTLVYGPLFIAMGTTVTDLVDTEFVLLGADRPEHTEPVAEVYHRLHDRPVAVMSVDSAELTKVAYNVAISCKIVLANTLMEICEKTGADIDQVTDALAMATDRVASAKYLRGGMGDGGHCHPRDLVAMSWLAQRLDLSYDLLGQMALAREVQSEWLARLVTRWCEQTSLKVFVMGRSYKPESPLTGGSPALLLAEQLGHPHQWDPYVDGGSFEPDSPYVFVAATRHAEFVGYAYPAGSVVIDPWGYIPDQPGVTVVRVGRKW